MARMIPKYIAPGTESNAEIRMFGLLQDELPNEWIVLHSLNLTAASQTRSGETDFAVISPYGVFCLEAKTGAVRVEDGVWYLGASGSEEGKNPFEQSLAASDAIYKFLRGRSPIGRDVLTGSGVLLPDVNFHISSMEVNKELVYDQRDRKNEGLQAYVERIADYWFKERYIPEEKIRQNLYNRREMEAIARTLRPNFDFKIPLLSELEAIQEKLIKLTDDQYDVLEQIDFDLNPRLMVEGGAGSGKTLCAVEIAKSQSQMGKNVLFTCFNKKLAARIRRVHLKQFPGITVKTFHHLMTQIVKNTSSNSLAGKSSSPNLEHFFREELPLACMEALNNSIDGQNEFDAVIVDEAQDLLTENYILVLDEIIRNGLENGQWAFFLDAKQSIFESSAGSVSSQLMGYGPSRHRLKYNCRNTTATAKLANILSGYETGIPRLEAPELEPIIWYKDANHEVRQVSNLISRWLSEGIKPNEITVLSHRKLDRSSLANGLSDNVPLGLRKLYDWTEDEESPIDDLIKYSTTQSFKGLESKMVIVAGIDYLRNPERPNTSEIHHTSVTRSTGVTVASISEKLRPEIESRLDAVNAGTLVENEPENDIANFEVEVPGESEESLSDDTKESPRNIFQKISSTVSRLIQSIRNRTN